MRKRLYVFIILLVFFLYSATIGVGVEICKDRALKCTGSQVQVCSDGQWIDEFKCIYGCDNGKCLSSIIFINESYNTWEKERLVCVNNSLRCSKVDDVEFCKSNEWSLKQDCKFGCRLGRCATEIGKNLTVEKEVSSIFLCKGCVLNKSCYAVGTRSKDMFCNKTGEWEKIKDAEECDASFECGSGFCSKGLCIQERDLKLPEEELVEELEEPVVEDTRSPEIDSRTIEIIPSAGVAGTIFTIKATVTDNLGPLSVSTTLLHEDEVDSYEIILYDDGLHDDEDAEDNKFAGVWDSTESSIGTYTINVTASDAGGNTVSWVNINAIQIVEEFPCNEVISSHNNLDENRINVVFVFLNYNHTGERVIGIEEFTRQIVNETETSLLKIEPFASNQNLFNFFYVDNVSFVDGYLEGFENWAPEATLPMQSLAVSCIVPNKHVVGFIDWYFRSNAIPGTAKVSIMERDSRLSSMESNTRLTAHEFGHSFGLLRDEYIEGGSIREEYQNNAQCYYSSLVSCFEEEVEIERGDNVTVVNRTVCDVPEESVLGCEESTIWRDLLGNGCGEDGIIDCTEEDINYFLEESCFNIGCHYTNELHRHSFNTIMRSQILDPFSYGPSNQRLICNQLLDNTGTAFGICDNLCLEGCEEGQRCIGGFCGDM